MKILLILLLSINLYPKYIDILNNLSSKQIEVLKDAYNCGLNDDLSLTLIAIAWKESYLGLAVINPRDGKFGSFGAYHLLLQNVLLREGLRATYSNIYKTRNKILDDSEFSCKYALVELNFWHKKYKGNKGWYRKMIASYNAGHRGIRSKRGRRYADDIIKRVQTLKIYINK